MGLITPKNEGNTWVPMDNTNPSLEFFVSIVLIALSGDVDDVSRSGYVWINQDAKGEVSIGWSGVGIDPCR